MIEVLRNRILPLAGLVLLGALAGAGLVPLMPLGNDEPPTSEPVAPPTVPSLPTTVVVDSTEPVVELPGVNTNISRVLSETGYASRLGRAELQSDIDAAIVQVLEQSDAVVTVVEPQSEEDR